MARVLSQAVLAEIERARARYPRPQSAVLPALHAAQEEVGYLSPEALDDVAEALGLPVTEVASVATFYSMFFTEPVGRHKIRVCTNLSCYLNGCEEILDHLCRTLGGRPRPRGGGGVPRRVRGGAGAPRRRGPPRPHDPGEGGRAAARPRPRAVC